MALACQRKSAPSGYLGQNACATFARLVARQAACDLEVGAKM
jgi:hypothetical protein